MRSEIIPYVYNPLFSKAVWNLQQALAFWYNQTNFKRITKACFYQLINLLKPFRLLCPHFTLCSELVERF
ncbi:unnamed protein product [Moneuplotes crassus]|uniref:Uncharacterized protein n=1 Tax=Euplotes crassus TaxID=5936 RepID=A0AAD2D8N9_EUPCR|nr:unnamed protein product [Moneuplotes crassus]